MSSKRLISILLITSMLVSMSVQVSAINTQPVTVEESTVAELKSEVSTENNKMFFSTDSTKVQSSDEVKTEISTENTSRHNNSSKQESGNVVDTPAIKSIVTSVKSVVLENGTSQKIDIETDPSDVERASLKWQSTNNDIVEVDNDGNITAKGVGSCTVKVYAAESSDIYGYCAVTVTQKVQEFAFKDVPKEMTVGEKVSVSTNMMPSYSTNKILKWTSSDKTVATVSQRGVITAVGSGSCTVTATTADGSEISKSFDIECTGEAVAPTPVTKAAAISVATMRKFISDGNSFKMETTVSPSNTTDKSLQYISSNDKVATVDENGNVQAVAKGTCVIYVSTKDGSNLRTGCVLTVEGKATSMQFSRKSVVCYVGDTADLKPKGVPNGTYLSDVVYKSSDESVATVDANGIITALSKGSCSVFCISADGETVYDKSSITVNLPVSSIKIYGDDTIVKGKTTTLVAKLLPSDADNKDVSWSSSNSSVAVVTYDGVVYGLEVGETTIICRSRDGSGVLATKKIVVEEEPDVVHQLINIAVAQTGNGPSKYREWFYDYEGWGIPWCAVFVSWCFRQVDGLGKYIVASDGAGSIARESVAAGLSGKWYESEYTDSTTTPQIGDVIEFVWNYEGRYAYQDIYFSDHVGLVYKVDDDYVYTVEGNAGATNDTSSVKLRSYSRESGAINGYYRPDYTK